MNELSRNFPDSPPASARRARLVVSVVMIGLSCVLLFARLGNKPLWDDEAITAMTSASVWETGDTGAPFGNNIVLYRNGLLLDGLHDRYTSPLQFYLAAPCLGLIGRTSLAARLPFALAGLATVLVLVRWLWKERAGAVMSLLVGLATLGNVSLFLYARTCRYYALTTLFSLCVAYFYIHFDRSRRALWGLIVSSLLLLASNYLSFGALWVCIAVDFACFGRKGTLPTWKDVATIGAVHAVVLVALLCVWNPLGRNHPRTGMGDWLVDRIVLVGWSCRDLNRSEFAIILLVALAPLLAWRRRRPVLARGALSGAAYVVVVSVLSPQDLSGATEADVRYLTPLIPLGIGLGAATVHQLCSGKWLPALIAGLIAFTTNALYGTALTGVGPRSTVGCFARELMMPPPDPYSQAIAWVDANVKPVQTVWVVPDFMVYPLMFHAPHALYAWQLKEPVKPSLQTLSAFHFYGRVLPDVIIAFGPPAREVKKPKPEIASAVARFEWVQTIDTFWKDQYRPELMWHRFAPRRNFDRGTEAIYVYRRRAGLTPVSGP